MAGRPKDRCLQLGRAMVWQAIGYYMVMYMASMSAIRKACMKALTWKALLVPHSFLDYIAFDLDEYPHNPDILHYFQYQHELLVCQAMTGGGPDGASEVFLSYMYKQAYTNSTYGYGMAVGVVVFSFSFALAAVVNRVTKREPLEF